MRQPTLLLPPVTLSMRWQDLLGEKMLTISNAERRSRWAQWLRIAKRVNQPASRHWRNNTECKGCKHLRGAWCCLQALPCTVNPLLTFRHDEAGLACMGAGREERP